MWLIVGGGVISTPVCTHPHVDICSPPPQQLLWLLGGKVENHPILSLMTILLLRFQLSSFFKISF